MHSSSEFKTGRSRTARRIVAGLLCAVAVLAAGCHNNNLNSGYGIAWVTLTADPGPFTSYIVNVDSVTLTRNDGAVVTALATPETVDFTKLTDIAELWGSASVPIGTYTSASIVLDYTSAEISVMVNGLPVTATVRDTSDAAVTTVTINVVLDSNTANQLTIVPTYATTAAQRFAIDFDLNASTYAIDLNAATPVVVVQPYLTAAIAPADSKPIRIRGPLINSSVALGTYTVYERPFHDEVDNLGTLTLFTDANTIFTTNGVVKQGQQGLDQLSQSSAGATVTAAYTTFQPTATPTATAGKFTALYVLAGSTLEDVYTYGLEGDVVQRVGDTLILRGSTLSLNTGVSCYNTADAEVLLGPNTLVTADNTTLTNLNLNDVAVGQHIVARGTTTSALCTTSTLVLDATGSTTNTGSVRLLQTHLWGPIVSAAAGSVLLDVSSINNWPASDFEFAGNGTSGATTPVAGSFAVNTGALTVPDTKAGDPLWIDGLVAPFGSAPPAFTAYSVNDELGVQTAGQGAQIAAALPNPPNPLVDPTVDACAPGNFHCVAASMQVSFPTPGSGTPFSAVTATTLTPNLSAANYAVIRIGPESIDMKALPAAPQIVSIVPPVGTPTILPNTPGAVEVTVPQIFLPAYSYGNPLSQAPGGIAVFSAFSAFTEAVMAAAPTYPAQQVTAHGTYNRATNTFTALSVNVVL